MVGAVSVIEPELPVDSLLSALSEPVTAAPA